MILFNPSLLVQFRTFAPVTKVLFNDARVPFVRPFPDRDNHMHIELRG